MPSLLLIRGRLHPGDVPFVNFDGLVKLDDSAGRKNELGDAPPFPYDFDIAAVAKRSWRDKIHADRQR